MEKFTCIVCGKQMDIEEIYPVGNDYYCHHCFEKRALKADKVNHPAHYASGNIECIDALVEVAKGKDPFVAHCLCTTVKYLWRAGSKEPDQNVEQTAKEKLIEDLEKGKWYLEKAISYTKTSN